MCTTEILLTLPAIQSRAKESGDEKSFLSGGWTSTEKFCTVTSAIAGNLKPFFSSSSKNGKQCLWAIWEPTSKWSKHSEWWPAMISDTLFCLKWHGRLERGMTQMSSVKIAAINGWWVIHHWKVQSDKLAIVILPVVVNRSCLWCLENKRAFVV